MASLLARPQVARVSTLFNSSAREVRASNSGSQALQGRRALSVAAAQPPEPITLSVGGKDARCLCIRGEQDSSNGAVLMLCDIYGIGTADNVAVASKLADEVYTTVYMPDLFNGNPWPQDEEAGTPAFEEWREALPPRWAIDVVLEAGRHAAAAGAAAIGLVGFCYGGGRMVDVLANAPAKDELVKEAIAAAQTQGKSAEAIQEDLVVPAYAGGVSFYGTRVDTEALKTVKTPLKLFIAENDPLVSKEEVSSFQVIEEELCQKGIFCEVRVFKDQPHGFAHQSGVGDDAVRSEALLAATDFLLALV